MLDLRLTVTDCRIAPELCAHYREIEARRREGQGPSRYADAEARARGVFG
jgi:hypothetical protein